MKTICLFHFYKSVYLKYQCFWIFHQSNIFWILHLAMQLIVNCQDSRYNLSALHHIKITKTGNSVISKKTKQENYVAKEKSSLSENETWIL